MPGAIRGEEEAMTRYPDAHTHAMRTPLHPFDLVNIELPFDGKLDERRIYSAGIHPCSNPAGWEKGFAQLEQWITLPQLRAIGECGLDRRFGAPPEEQKKIFLRQVALAAVHGKPLVLHNYKASDEMLKIHNIYSDIPFILHGFRSNVSVMEMFRRRGFFFSYGIRFNAEALKNTPIEYLLLETDEASEEALQLLYTRVAALRGMCVEELAEQMKKNMSALFSI